MGKYEEELKQRYSHLLSKKKVSSDLMVPIKLSDGTLEHIQLYDRLIVKPTVSAHLICIDSDRFDDQPILFTVKYTRYNCVQVFKLCEEICRRFNEFPEEGKL